MMQQHKVYHCIFQRSASFDRTVRLLERALKRSCSISSFYQRPAAALPPLPPSCLFNHASIKNYGESSQWLSPAVSNTLIINPGFAPSSLRIGYSPETTKKVILDPKPLQRVILDPQWLNVVQPAIEEPKSSNIPEYQARHIQKIRRWHMNRHKLKKLRKRMRMVYRKRKVSIKKLKAERLRGELAAIKKDGEQFDALAFVKERIVLAKSGGFVQDIWQSSESQPATPWVEYSIPSKRLRTYERKVFPAMTFRYRKRRKNKSKK